MATARLKKVDEFLTCTICYDMYTDPCTLTCLHTFCRKCVTQYTKTRPEALQTKTIPCPSCRQVTKVPDPTKPVEKWAWQIKPSIIILGLIDTSQPNPTTPEGRSCDTCQQIGETTAATSWCHECKVALCVRCTKIHHASPASRDHEVCDLPVSMKGAKIRKVICREHKTNFIEFHCKDCKKSACQKCCIIYHRACKSVLNIESMREEMVLELLKKRDVAMDKIKQRETRLMNQLVEVTEKQGSQLQAGVKTDEIEVQMYRQHCEFIDQAVNSECVMDMYDMYQACESGTLVLGDVGASDTVDRPQVEEWSFTQNHNKLSLPQVVGVPNATHQETVAFIDSPVLTETTDVRTESDRNITDIKDVTVLDVDGVQTVVVTDWENDCLKAVYARNNKSCHSRLSLPHPPFGIAQLKENKVLVTVPNMKQIITVEVTPDLVQLSTIKPWFTKQKCS